MVLVLVILLVVSMLGMAGMETSGLEMRMASHGRDQQAAFEAAESALAWMASQIASEGFSDASLANLDCVSQCFDATCSAGYCFAGNQPLDWQNCTLPIQGLAPALNAALWQDDSGRHQTWVSAAVEVKLTIEFLCYTAPAPGLEMGADNYAQRYRITVLAEGEAGRGRAMLRSTYRLPVAFDATQAGAGASRMAWEILEIVF